MDTLFCVVQWPAGWTGDKLRFILAGEDRREVWTLTMDMCTGTGQARRDGAHNESTSPSQAREGVADEPVLLDGQVAEDDGRLPGEKEGETSV